MGVLITGLDVLLLLGLMKLGFRKLEATVAALVGTVAGCYVIELLFSKPAISGIMGGFLPTLHGGNSDYLFLALGIIGATVMPHNLYLHSSIVQTRERQPGKEGLRQAIKFNTLDTIASLTTAFVVNAAILVLAASALQGQNVDDLEKAHGLLRPALGGAAATVFALGLLASGQSSTITGTLAGQIVMEGFLQIKMKPWIQRLLTRGVAIVPAVIMIAVCGDQKTNLLLVVSQVVLSMQLPLAMYSLISFTSNKKVMGEHANPIWMQILAWGSGAIVTGLNIKLLIDSLGLGWVIVGCIALALFVGWNMKATAKSRRMAITA
jgi:manganese transport protein